MNTPFAAACAAALSSARTASGGNWPPSACPTCRSPVQRVARQVALHVLKGRDPDNLQTPHWGLARGTALVPLNTCHLLVVAQS